MTPINTLSEVFSQTSTLLNGLLSEIGAGSANSNLFSSLLSQGDAASLPQPSPPTPAINGAASSYATLTTPPSGSSLLQALQDISTTMQSILTLLHRQSGSPASTSTQQSSSQTAPASQNSAPANSGQTTIGSDGTSSQTNLPASSQGSLAGDKAALTTTTDASASPTAPDPKKLADVVAQLLLLFQSLIQNLQQPKIATGATPDPLVSAPDATGVSNSPDKTTPAGDLTTKTLASIESLLSGIAGTAPITGSLEQSPTTQNSVDQLSQILADLQNMTGSLVPATAANLGMAQSMPQETGGAESSISRNATSTDIIGSIAVQIALFDEKINHLLNVMKAKSTQQPDAFSPPVTVSPKIVAANSVSPELSLTPLSFSQSPSSSFLSIAQPSSQQPLSVPSKQDLSGAWQNQAFSFQTSTTTGSTPPSAAQVFANSAALVAVAEHNTTSTAGDSGSNFLSDNQNGSAPILQSTNQAFSAEGTQATGTYNFASTLSALRATNGGSIGLPSVIDQVVLQMSRNVKSGNDQMTLQLNPADLGKITIKLDFGSNNKVQGTVTADNPQTLSLIQKDQRSLERALQDAGLRADPGSLQFNLSSQGGNGSGGNAGQAGSNANNLPNGGQNGTQSAGDSSGLVDLSTVAETYYITPNGVNIQV